MDQIVQLQCSRCGHNWVAKAFERCRGCSTKSTVRKVARGYVNWVEKEDSVQNSGK